MNGLDKRGRNVLSCLRMLVGGGVMVISMIRVVSSNISPKLDT